MEMLGLSYCHPAGLDRRRDTHAIFKIVFVVHLVGLAGASSGQERAGSAVSEGLRPAVVGVVSYDADGKAVARGSGFFVSERGDILTRRSLIPKEAVRAEVTTSDGKVYRLGRVVSADKESGIVRVLVENPPARVLPLPCATFGPQIGDSVVVLVGNSTGAQGIRGVVVDASAGTFSIAISAPGAAPGAASGSPVINARGQAVGIVVAAPEAAENVIAYGTERFFTLYPRAAAFQPFGTIKEESNPGLTGKPGALLLGHAVTRVAPAYPAVAKALKVDGTVMVRVIVDEDGNVSSAVAFSTNLQCHSGGADGVPPAAEEALKQAAVEALRQWKFVPSTFAGKKVKGMGAVTLQFHL